MINPINEVYQVYYGKSIKLCLFFKSYLCLEIPLFTGQNLAMGYENWSLAVGGWIEEKEHYAHGYPSTGIVGHYTQVNLTSKEYYHSFIFVLR
jgi:hypothetical protein